MRRSLSLMLLAMAFCGWSRAYSAQLTTTHAWMDPELSADARADLVQSEMTLDEQLLLLKGYYGANVKIPWIKPAPNELRSQLPGSAGFVPGIERLGIPALHETDAGAGIANTNWMRPGDMATAFPSGLLNAATWNTAIAFTVGTAIGKEARDRAFNVVLNGALNLAREPRSGRTFEYAGEDPLLAGAIVGEEIRGIQSQHLISTTKHFALNDEEIGRMILSANIDEASARESDLLAFEIALERGNPGAVMCAYNRYNGIYACENNFLLNDVLKHDWNYSGWVLSDWGAVHSTAVAANAGLDQESASGFDHEEYFGEPLKAALADGTISPARLHDMVNRIVRTMFANGLIDYPIVAGKPSTHIEAAQSSAEEGIVLLENKNHILPLSRDVRTIAIIGSHANIGMLSGGGSSQVVPIGHNPDNEVYVGGAVRILQNGARIIPTDRMIYDPPSPLAAIAAAAPRAVVRYLQGNDVLRLAREAASADIAIVFAEQWMIEGKDVKDLALTGKQNDLISAIAAANPHTIVVLETGGPVVMPWLEHVQAVLETWYAGSGGATALAHILFGDTNPSGRLPITFPQAETQLPRPALPDTQSYLPFDITYSEGADVGYRWFERQKQKPLFPFGFGLSYTDFTLSNFSVSDHNGITATVEVKNTGSRSGSEVVQIYVTPPSSNAVARLSGWSKVTLDPGESKIVTVNTEPRSYASFDIKAHNWWIEAGSYTVEIGTSGSNIATRIPISLPDRRRSP